MTVRNMHKKKEKRKQHKKDKQTQLSQLDRQSETQLLKNIKRLEKELRKRDEIIERLNHRLKKDKAGKGKKDKSTKHVPTPLFGKLKQRVSVTQRWAWQRHEYLRDRYEFHLGSGQEKSQARSLADRDLRDKYGENAGYSEQELEDILS
jgi:hypothetical protein